MPATFDNDADSNRPTGVSPSPDCIVLTLTATGIAVVRDVASLGGRVIGIDADRGSPGHSCSELTAIAELSHAPLDADLVGKLVRYAEQRAAPPVIIPASDAAVEFLIAHRAALAGSCAVSSAMTDDIAGVLLDKLRFARKCEDLGVNIPITVLPENHADVADFVRRAGLPCIVKPRTGHLWRKRLQGAKLLVPKTEAELRHAIDEVVGDPGAVVLQELIPGPEREIVVGACLLSESGEPQHVLTARKHRQFPLDFGSGALVIAEDLPEVRERSLAALTALGYRGVCGTEFKRDPRTNQLRLVEINARPVLWYDLCRAAGTSLVAAHFRELAGMTAVPIAPQRDGTVWRYLTRDVIAVAQRHRKLFRVMAELKNTPRADTFATMTTTDPKTIAATVRHTALQAISHLAGHK